MTTTATTTGTTSTSPIFTPAQATIPMAYSLGMVAATLDNFSGKNVLQYFEKLEQRASLDGWSEDETVKLFKFKLAGEAYQFFKSDSNLNNLSFRDLKARFIEKFLPTKLPGENQLILSRCYQRQEEDVSSYCTRLRVLGVKLLNEDLENAAADEVAGLKKKNKEILLNQFKIGLRKDLMKEIGILLLQEPNLDLDKAEQLVKLQETTQLMIQGKERTSKVWQINNEKKCFQCGKMGHIARECRNGNGHDSAREGNCYSCGKRGHFARECRRGRDVKEVKCYSCNKMGHYARECLEKQDRPTDRRNWGSNSQNNLRTGERSSTLRRQPENLSGRNDGRMGDNRNSETEASRSKYTGAIPKQQGYKGQGIQGKADDKNILN